MIKFFRKIRQNLLSEGKTEKYFKYAIGEIALVVIGILSALSINNWNTERQNENRRISFLVKLELELDYNDNRLIEMSKIYDEILESNLKLYDTLMVRISPQNIEEYLQAGYYTASTLNLSSSNYEQMKGTGNLHTLKSDTLINTIEAYYRLCEREEFYIFNTNALVMNNTYYELNKGLSKAQLDYNVRGLHYALQNNAWLLDNQSEEYAELSRELLVVNGSINDNINRINRILDTSNNLKELIKINLEKDKI